MLLDLDVFRQRIGLQPGDTSRDAELTPVILAASQLIEVYCDRKFGHTTGHVEQFAHVEGTSVSLELYPIESVTKLEGTDVDYHIDRRAGLLLFDGRIRAHELTVTYSGGFKPDAFPDALGWAYLGVFDNLWASKDAGSALGAGVVKSVASDGARVEYFNPTDGGGAAGVDEDSGLPYVATALLAPWRRWSA